VSQITCAFTEKPLCSQQVRSARSSRSVVEVLGVCCVVKGIGVDSYACPNLQQNKKLVVMVMACLLDLWFLFVHHIDMQQQN